MQSAYTGDENMIETYLLEELATFAKTGTLAKTAIALNVTQPTITRGMQKLESDLGVQLFQRLPNKISLTPTGVLAAQVATELMKTQQKAITTIQNFDRKQHRLTIGTTLPGPLFLLKSNHRNWSENIYLDVNILANVNLNQVLTQNDYSLLFSNQDLQTPEIQSVFLGTENLWIHLNQFMYQANQQTISFAELKGLTFFVANDIGPWRSVIQENIPEAKFFYQKQRAALTEITKYTDFPYFSTNLSKFDPTTPLDQGDRIGLPIRDKTAQMPIYANFLRSEKKRIQSILQKVQVIWP